MVSTPREKQQESPASACLVSVICHSGGWRSGAMYVSEAASSRHVRIGPTASASATKPMMRISALRRSEQRPWCPSLPFARAVFHQRQCLHVAALGRRFGGLESTPSRRSDARKLSLAMADY